MKTLAAVLPLAILANAIYIPSQVNIEDEAPRSLALDGIPLLGFGTWNLKGDNASEAVSYAIQIGYRHIDCATAYGNQYTVGLGIADGIKKAGISREDLWITSKLWNDHHDPDRVEEAAKQTVAELGVGYLDLWHMHWPVADGAAGKKIEYIDTWAAMTYVAESGLVRHLGVSNFSPNQLEDLLNNTNHPPSVHQMELHPYLQQSDWVAKHQKHGVHVTAYSPLGGTNPTYEKGDPKPLLANKVVEKVAKKRGCTPAQVALQWGISRGTSVIPKSIHKEYIKQNLLALECKLKKKDLKKIDDLGKAHHRYNNPGKGWGVDLYEGLEDSKGKHKSHS